jgi:hypothetical protein
MQRYEGGRGEATTGVERRLGTYGSDGELIAVGKVRWIPKLQQRVIDLDEHTIKEAR